jgi:hypothetical protein
VNLKTFYVLSGVALEGFGKGLLKNHMTEIKELIKRDKNRPSVVMWSLANEPRFSFVFLLLLICTYGPPHRRSLCGKVMERLGHY